MRKYTDFNRFPWKLMIHILLVIALSASILLRVENTTSQYHSQLKIFYRSFLNSAADYTATKYPRTLWIYTMDDFLDHIKSGTKTFFSINDSTLSKYERDPDTFPEMTIYYSDWSRISRESCIFYLQTQNDLGIFNNQSDDSIRNLLAAISNIQIHYPLKTNERVAENRNLIINRSWDIKLSYNIDRGASVNVTLDTIRHVNPDSRDEMMKSQWIQALIILLAGVSLVTQLRYFVDIASSFTDRKNQLTSRQLKASFEDRTGWEYLTLWDKLHFFSVWNLFMFFGNIIQIGSGFFFLFYAESTNDLFEMGLGLGAMIAWITLLKYHQYDDKYNILVKTLKFSYPNLFFIVSLTPLFLGMLFFAMMVFAGLPGYETFSGTAILLFAQAFGDVLLNNYMVLINYNRVLGLVFSIAFLTIFTIIGCRFLLALMEETYVWTLNQKQYLLSELEVSLISRRQAEKRMATAFYHQPAREEMSVNTVDVAQNAPLLSRKRTTSKRRNLALNSKLNLMSMMAKDDHQDDRFEEIFESTLRKVRLSLHQSEDLLFKRESEHADMSKLTQRYGMYLQNLDNLLYRLHTNIE